MPLTPEGLVVPRYPEIVENNKELFRKLIDANIDTSDDTLLGELIQAISEREDLLYKLQELVYDGRNLNSATDKALDDIGLLKGIQREAASPTSGYQIFTGDLNTVIPTGTVVGNTDTLDRYETLSTYSITNLNLVAAKVSVLTVLDNTIYTLNVGGTSYSINSGTSAGALTIVTAIKALIDSDPSSSMDATLSGSALVLNDSTYSSNTITLSSNMEISEGSILAYAYAQESGPKSVSIGSNTNIVTPVLGVTSTYNPYTYTAGSNRESNEDYRIRLKSPSSYSGKATIPAIRAAVSSVTGVSYVTVEHNNTLVDGDIPKKKVHVIVQGGIDSDIAEAIFDSIGAPAITHGSITEVVIDEGQPHEISFSRPSGRYFAVRVQYEIYDEEILSDDHTLLIRNAVVNSINALGIGIDLIPGRIYKEIYSNTQGIGKLNIETQEISSPGDPATGTWSDDTVPITSTNFAQVALIDVTTVEV